jgi:type II secretory ATPase GspE/PulE/Tfp pilus assembly ATPase PilB-like protein
VNGKVRGLIERGAPVIEIEREAIGAEGSMWAMGLKLVAGGETSVDELLRVARPDD